ncbi:MAG: hypothetical protein H7Y27_04110 [Gemmatimonadaceae bacterium]|nr:hypothetical protein [Chitinophagaceae bacterium]
MKLKLIAIAAFLTFAVNTAKSQSTEDSVKTAVNLLFEGMKKADPAKIAASFGDSAVLQTISRTKEGSTVIRNVSVKDFATSIGKLAAGAADEQISFGSIKIDGPLASVWTPYKFYFNGQFSHCGVNSFQMVRINGVWKIQYLIDTRRKTNCE